MVPAGVAGFVLLGACWRIGKGALLFDRVYSDGERVGQVIEVSRDGLLWKTWEARLAVTQTGSAASLWSFSVDAGAPGGDARLELVRRALRTGAFIRVRYEERMAARPVRGKTAYMAAAVEPWRRGR